MNPAKTSRASGKLNYTIQVGKHTLLADADLEAGGEDTGPSPHELLASALAACTSITLQMYAGRKAWPLKDAQVEVTIVHTPLAAVFERKIKLVGELDTEQKARLLEIAEHCPVHKTLTGKIEIQTTLI